MQVISGKHVKIRFISFRLHRNIKSATQLVRRMSNLAATQDCKWGVLKKGTSTTFFLPGQLEPSGH